MLNLHEENTYRKRGNDPLYLQVANLRLDFVDKMILKPSTESYSTQVERDWSYLVRREYRYKVILKSMGHSFFIGNVGVILATFAKRKLQMWPMVLAVPSFFFFQNRYRYMHNKRFFDMCNVGEEYELGFKRNLVLRQCNEILDVEDF